MVDPDAARPAAARASNARLNAPSRSAGPRARSSCRPRPTAHAPGGEDRPEPGLHLGRIDPKPRAFSVDRRAATLPRLRNGGGGDPERARRSAIAIDAAPDGLERQEQARRRSGSGSVASRPSTSSRPTGRRRSRGRIGGRAVGGRRPPGQRRQPLGRQDDVGRPIVALRCRLVDDRREAESPDASSPSVSPIVALARRPSSSSRAPSSEASAAVAASIAARARAVIALAAAGSSARTIAAISARLWAAQASANSVSASAIVGDARPTRRGPSARDATASRTSTWTSSRHPWQARRPVVRTLFDHASSGGSRISPSDHASSGAVAHSPRCTSSSSGPPRPSPAPSSC